MSDSECVEEFMAELPAANVLGINICALRVDELHQQILSAIVQNQKKMILHANIYGLNLACEQPWLHDFLNSADLVFCDGYGVILGARMLGWYIPERITYADWAWQLAGFASQNSISLFFLGGQPGIAEKAAMNLQSRFPNLKIVGCHDGFFDKSPENQENEEVLKQINTTHPDILLVGFGMPLQEKWLMENWPRIDTHVGLTGGAVFDYLSGEVPRAPRWMTDHGLEWLGRLVIEPRRLWKRYLIGNPLFFWRVLKQRLGLIQFYEPS